MWQMVYIGGEEAPRRANAAVDRAVESIATEKGL